MGLNKKQNPCYRLLLFSAATALAVVVSAQEKPAVKLDPSALPKLGTVDARYLSYNIEMVEVTGGRFWKPYNSPPPTEAEKQKAQNDPNQQVGISPTMFQYRPPIDLANPRLRKLAEALGPSYVRVSGTWANSTYFQDDDNPAAAEAPTGFKTILTRAAVEGRDRFCPCRRRADRHFRRHQCRNPGRQGRVDSRAGKGVLRIHKARWWKHRCNRVHERADLSKSWRRSQRLRCGRIRSRCESL